VFLSVLNCSGRAKSLHRIFILDLFYFHGLFFRALLLGSVLSPSRKASE
jgi:hypothetical protein